MRFMKAYFNPQSVIKLQLGKFYRLEAVNVCTLLINYRLE